MSQGFGRLPKVAEVDVNEAKQRTDAGEAVVIDVREIEEYDYRRLPSAVNIPLGDLMARTSELPTDADILVYCQTGVRAAFGTDMLNKAGFERAINVAGGIVAWEEAGLPIQNG